MSTSYGTPCTTAKGERVKLRAYVLAKNEEANIGACLKGLAHLSCSVHVLDSGSTDATIRIAKSFANVEVETYRYIDHVTAYNEICFGRPSQPADYLIILDADMVIFPELAAEVLTELENGNVETILAPVKMYWNGSWLRWGSLCPPKPFVFRNGSTYFEAKGHGEALRPGLARRFTKNSLVHDDKKPYRAYLETQARYAEALALRATEARVTWRDRIRSASP